MLDDDILRLSYMFLRDNPPMFTRFNEFFQTEKPVAYLMKE